MDTFQIVNVLKCNKYTSKYFKGVFAINKIPKFIKRPSIIVVNTDHSTKPGAHWIAILCPYIGCIEYFDSYGRRPIQNEFLQFLKRNSLCYIVNGRRLQSSFSDVCGHYCCVYLWYRCKGKSMQFFLNRFNRYNFEDNDKNILITFKKIFKHTKKHNNNKKYKNKLQICRFGNV